MIIVEDVMTYTARREMWVCKEASVLCLVFCTIVRISSFCVHSLCVYVLATHTHNDMQMDVSQNDANDFIITKDISTVKIKIAS